VQPEEGMPMNFEQLHTHALAMLVRGEWQAARTIGSEMLALAPTLPAGYFVSGVAASRLQQLQPAIELLRHAVLLDDARPEYFAELSRACITQGLAPEAVAAADRAMALAPRDAQVLDMLGVIYGQAGFHEKAGSAFRSAVEAMPGSGASRFNLASSLSYAGDIDAAEHEFESCLRVDPAQWRAHLWLARLRRQTPERNHVERLRTLLAANASQEAQLYLNMALAKELEDLADYPHAFAHFVAGKTAGGRGRGYSTQRDEAMFDAIARCFPEPVVGTSGFESEEPIFVVGMPRSGTTLVERILSSHPAVHASGELRNFLVALHNVAANSPQFVLDPTLPSRMGAIDWRRLGREYVESTRPGTGHTPRFVDKLPHNFLYAGFIALALPNARIVCLRRDPVDTCLSNFRQLFALESPYFDYSYDLMDTGRYYILFDRLMAHWQRVLPGRILQLSYEDLVDDQRAQTQRLLEFCGLPWDDACLAFERNRAPVATASAVQVREPMNRRSVGRWQHYAPELRGLLALLAGAGLPPTG
jgi:tetratricopeptide (TPR) repeat protein